MLEWNGKKKINKTIPAALTDEHRAQMKHPILQHVVHLRLRDMHLHLDFFHSVNYIDIERVRERVSKRLHSK